MYVMDRAAYLGASGNNLQKKLSSMYSESSAKDDVVMKHAQVAEEAIAGWEKAEAEAMFLKQELEESLRSRIAAEERILDLDSALKECIHQLRRNQEGQHQRINDAVMHICREHEQEWMLLEEKLGETSKRLSKLDFENSHLSKALQTKEYLIEDLRKCKSQVEANLNKLMARVDAEDKSRLRSSDASHKEDRDNRNKIMMLEQECQRLRRLLQNQLPGTATLGKMRSEVLGMEQDKINLVKNTPSGNSSSRTADFLIEKLSSMEEENRTLKETVSTKNNEIQSLRTMVAQNASNMWSLSKVQATMDPARTTISHDLSHTSLSENGHEDEISCSESWASALITELEHLTSKNPKGAPSPKIVEVSDMNLMDDFVEMEKLARSSTGKYPNWIQDILGSILWQNHVTGRNPEEILEEVRNALSHICHSGTQQVSDARERKGSSRSADHSSDTPPNATQVMNSTKGLESEASKSIYRMIELIEGIAQPSEDNVGGYIVRVFQWKSSDLDAVLQQFVHACSDISNGRASLESFPTELSSAMEWVLNHCFSIQDVSSMRDRVKKRLDWNGSESESELGDDFPQMEEMHAKLNEDNRMLKQKVSNMEIVQKDLEEKLQKATENITRFQDDLSSQITVVRNELSVAHQNSFALELELENKINCCQELETTCIELQLQLDSVVHRDVRKHDIDQADGETKTESEIAGASEKLAECEENILNLGKQIEELAGLAPDVKNKNASSRCSLLDQMLSEDNAKSEKPHIIAMIHHPLKAAASVAIVPSKRCSGVSLLKRIVLRRKRENGKKSLTMVT